MYCKKCGVKLEGVGPKAPQGGTGAAARRAPKRLGPGAKG